MLRACWVVLALALLSSARVWAQAGAPPTAGPYVHRVESASSSDGLTFHLDGVSLLEHASVPAAVVLPDGRIRIYYVDASTVPENANVAESRDGGRTFSPLGLRIAGRPTRKAVDPSIVRLPDGRWRLYYYALDDHPDTPQAHAIHAAVSVDGVHFTEEGAVFTYPGLVDPDVWWNGRQWVMWVFSLRDGQTVVATSADGLRFQYLGPLMLPGWGTVAPIRLDDGRFRLYAFDQREQRTVASFISTDGTRWTREPGERLVVPVGRQITDPWVIRMPDGTWKMFFKTENARRR